MDWDFIERILADLLVIFFGVWMTWGFWTILTEGVWVGAEPNTWIARGELLLSIGIMLFGIKLLVNHLRRDLKETGKGGDANQR